MEQENQEERRQTVKRGLLAKDVRRKREEYTVSIRKLKREEMINKRRNVSGALNKFQNQSSIEFQTLEEMVKACYGPDSSQWFPATQQIRQLLSVEHNPPINTVINTGVLPRIVQFLSYQSSPRLQFEAAWTLTNVASGSSEQTKHVIELGAIPIMIGLLASPEADLRDQAVWGLGNIAGDSSQCRDVVLEAGIVTPLIRLIFQDFNSSCIVKNATWTLANLCRGKPAPPFEAIFPTLQVFLKLLSVQDEDILTDTLWGLSYLTDGGPKINQAILEAGLVSSILPQLHIKNINMQVPGMRAIGNIVTGDHTLTQGVIEAGALRSLAVLIKDPKKCIRKEACWVISNIAAGTREQVNEIVKLNIIPPLVLCLMGSDSEIKKEACWALCNCIYSGGPTHFGYLLSQSCLEPMIELLTCNDNKLVQVILETLEILLKAGASGTTGTNLYAEMIKEAGGFDTISELQEHENHRIYNKAMRLLEEYFAEELSDEDIDTDATDEDLGDDNQHQTQGFQFSFPSSTPFPTGNNTFSFQQP